MEISCRQQGIQETFPPKPVCLQPLKKLFYGGSVGKNRFHLASRPPLFSQIPGFLHRKRALETPRICGDMDKLRQNLRRNGKPFTTGNQLRYQGTSGTMFGVFCQFRRDQKTGVYAVSHIRPSSISPNKSSSGEKGRRMRPTFTGGISNTLCPADGAAFRRSAWTNFSNSASSPAFNLGTAASISVNVLMSLYLATKRRPSQVQEKRPTVIPPQPADRTRRATGPSGREAARGRPSAAPRPGRD